MIFDVKKGCFWQVMTLEHGAIDIYVLWKKKKNSS